MNQIPRPEPQYDSELSVVLSGDRQWWFDGKRWQSALRWKPSSMAPTKLEGEQLAATDLNYRGNAATFASELKVRGSLGEVRKARLHPAAEATPAVDAPAPREVHVATYRDAKEYQREAPKMAALGWVPQAPVGQRGKVNMGRTIAKGVTFLPWALMRPSRQGDPITVTWTR
jgi:hypothetical protein